MDDGFLGSEHGLIGDLRRPLVPDVLARLDSAYSVDLAASLMQTAVVYPTASPAGCARPQARDRLFRQDDPSWDRPMAADRAPDREDDHAHA